MCLGNGVVVLVLVLVVLMEDRLVQEGSEQGVRRQFNQVVYPFNGHLCLVSVFSSDLQEGQPD